MKLSKLAEVGAALATATLVGVETLQHNHKEEEHKKEHKKSFVKFRHIALWSSVIATGLAFWEMRKHHHLAA